MSYKEKPIKVPRFEESAGFYTTKQRSNLMSKIKGKDTKPELLFRKALWKEGIKYRINCKNLPGKPDVANRSLKFVVFVDGEFWHGYKWVDKKVRIKTNRKFWIPKIERNIQRDKENTLKLEVLGFKVFRFWEKQIEKELATCVRNVVSHVKGLP